MTSLVLFLAAACLALPASAVGATIAVTKADDPPLTDASGCSLRQAIQTANTNAGVGACAAGEAAAVDVIQLPLSVALTIPGSDDANQIGDLDLLAGGPLRIEGTGAGLSTITQTAANERVLNLVAGSVELERLVITGGDVSALSPGVSYGGGIFARADTELTLIDSVVRGNAAKQAGGIANGLRSGTEEGGEMLIVNSTVSANTATANSGGGWGREASGTSTARCPSSTAP